MNAYKPLWDGIRPDKWSALIYYFIFCYRRMIFIVALIFLNSWPSLQLLSKISMSVLSIVYILQVRPHDINLMNRMEQINEFCILAFDYHLLVLMYKPQQPSEDHDEIMFNVGWSFIAIFTLFLMSNISILMLQSVRDIMRNRKKKKILKALEEQAKRHENEIKNRISV